MQQMLRVKRYDPENPEKAGYQEYTVEVTDTTTVLDALLTVREEIDGSLSMRCSCRASICGSCAMRVNGQAKLVCKTRVNSVSPNGEAITIDPAGNLPVIKDLVVEFKPFWDKMKAIKPYLLPEGVVPKAEYIASDEDMVHLVGVVNCIQCGACVSDCTVLEVDKSFLGPAALAKAYRFVKDPRDGHQKERLGILNESSGVWDCTRCMQCVEVCPKDVDPMGRIMLMRDMAMEAGYNNTSGSRHTESFAKSVKKNGRLDEAKLAVESMGRFNVPALLDSAPVGLRAIRKGKFPWKAHKSSSPDKVKRVFEKVEGE
ncbi:MAG: succinate dehydrogenase iron-sulfur subunit [Dehalococcoidia bacterium]